MCIIVFLSFTCRKNVNFPRYVHAARNTIAILHPVVRSCSNRRGRQAVLWDAIQCNWHKKSCYAAARKEQIFVLALSGCQVPVISPKQHHWRSSSSISSQSRASCLTRTVTPRAARVWWKTLICTLVFGSRSGISSDVWWKPRTSKSSQNQPKTL